MNFYRRFIRKYFHIVKFMITHLKIKSVKNSVQEQSESGETEMKWDFQVLKFFVLSTKTKLVFEKLKQIFLIVSIFHHFNQKHSIKIETDVSEFAISEILTQCEENEELKQHWLFMTFWSKKIKSVKLKYKTLNHELLAIIKTFKHWQHYLKRAHFSIIMLTNHKNLQIFMTIKKLLKR